MTLTFEILGVTLARIKLDLPDSGPRGVTPLDKGIKKMSGFWVSRMNR